MWDNSENDGHAETIMDYVISWCLRVAANDFCKKYKPILYHYCRFLLFKLLQIEQENNDKIVIEEVKVWKQWKRIDLWVEVTLMDNGQREKHSILIENKYYTLTHDTRDIDGTYKDQLEVYKKVFDNFYAQDNNIKKHYALITCLDNYPDQEKIQKLGYQLHTYSALQDEMASNARNIEPSESDIFNEFWINW